jgi:hypothetical protein
MLLVIKLTRLQTPAVDPSGLLERMQQGRLWHLHATRGRARQAVAQRVEGGRHHALGKLTQAVAHKFDKVDSAMLMPCSTRFILNSVIMGAAPGLNADTSRRCKPATDCSKPARLVPLPHLFGSAGVMRGACDQTQNHLRS